MSEDGGLIATNLAIYPALPCAGLQAEVIFRKEFFRYWPIIHEVCMRPPLSAANIKKKSQRDEWGFSLPPRWAGT